MAPRTGYCTLEELASAISDLRLAELTNDSGDTPDADKTALAIADAADLIDGYLAGRYAVPVTDTATMQLLRPRAIAMVKFALFGRRDLDSKDDPTRVQYDAAVNWLMAIQKGDGSLPPTAALAVASVSTVGGILIGHDCDEGRLR